MDASSVDRYLSRIGYNGDRKPTLETLASLQLKHLQTIPYENLNVHLQRPIIVDDLEKIEEKVFYEGRGGYCFELNQLFYHLLKALGFDVTPLLARVHWNLTPQENGGLVHLMLLVKIGDQRWIADVASGSVGSSVPLCIDHEELQPSENGEPHRIRQIGEREYLHQFRDSDGIWRDLYSFHCELVSGVADWTVANWFMCTHPMSHFAEQALVSIHTPNGSVSLSNSELSARSGKHVETKKITTKEEYLGVLEKYFKIPGASLIDLSVPNADWK